MELFDGKLEAKKLDLFISEKVRELSTLGKLAIIQIGTDEVSKKYVDLKLKVCVSLGITAEYIFIRESLADEEINNRIREILSRSEVTGAIIQLPLPRKSLKSVLNLLPADKDVDVLSSTNQFQYYSNELNFAPPVVRALKYFLDINDIEVHNKDVCIVGNGFLVGRPLEHFLTVSRAKVSVIANYVSGNALNYQLIILSAGIPKLVSGLDIAKNAVVIDFGSSILDGKVTGDLDIKSDLSHLSIVSPSPGGMGPLVVRFLILNHMKVYEIERSIV